LLLAKKTPLTAGWILGFYFKQCTLGYLFKLMEISFEIEGQSHKKEPHVTSSNFDFLLLD